jgi:pimeloyl-ACP methyl ester carboxylesterase
MELFTRGWGSGDRHAVLVHGVMSDSRNWRSVGPALAERGYNVTAVDLRGHGSSLRAAEYTAELLAEDLVETIPIEPELVMGHSLGGLTVSLAIERLRPQRAIYVDPAFTLPRLSWWQRPLVPWFVARMVKASTASIARRNPTWDPADVAIEAESFRQFDRAAISAALGGTTETVPATMLVPSLVVLADRSRLVKPALAESLRNMGFEIRIVAGAGHTVNRDDFTGFMAAVEDWL